MTAQDGFKSEPQPDCPCPTCGQTPAQPPEVPGRVEAQNPDSLSGQLVVDGEYWPGKHQQDLQETPTTNEESWRERLVGQAEKSAKKLDWELLQAMWQDPYISEVKPEIAKTALVDLRARAAGWSTGVASIFAAIFALLVIKDARPPVIVDRDFPYGLILGVAALLAPLSGLISLHFLLRAAHGPAKLDTRVKDLARPYTTRRTLLRLRLASQDFRRGQRFFVGALVLLIGILIFVWIYPANSN